VEIPILDLTTQGRTRREAREMVADMLETLVDKEGFKVEVYRGENDTFEIAASPWKHLVGLPLRRKREIGGLSLSQAAE